MFCRHWWWSNVKQVLAIVLVMLVGLTTAGCGNHPVTRTSAPSESAILTNRLTEVAPPATIQALRQALEAYQPQVKILSPRSNDVIQSDRLSVRFQVKDLPLFKDEELGLGPHLHVFLDNQPYTAVYNTEEPLVFENLTPGTHTIRAFASRPWHESFKNEGAFAQTTFHVYTKTPDNLPDPTQPLLTYSRPQGSYGAEPILLDFYLTNAPLHLIAQERSDDEIRDWKVRCTVNGQSFTFNAWEAIYLKGLKPGKNWVQLELLDENNNPFNNTFNNTVRVVTYEPDGDDTLSKLVRGDLSEAEARGMVDPNYVPELPTPELPAPEPTPELTPTPVPEADTAPAPLPSPESVVTPDSAAEQTELEPLTTDIEENPVTEPKEEAEPQEPEPVAPPPTEPPSESLEESPPSEPTEGETPVAPTPPSEPVKARGFFDRFKRRAPASTPAPVMTPAPAPTESEPLIEPNTEEAADAKIESSDTESSDTGASQEEPSVEERVPVSPAPETAVPAPPSSEPPPSEPAATETVAPDRDTRDTPDVEEVLAAPTVTFEERAAESSAVESNSDETPTLDSLPEKSEPTPAGTEPKRPSGEISKRSPVQEFFNRFRSPAPARRAVAPPPASPEIPEVIEIPEPVLEVPDAVVPDSDSSPELGQEG
ncbi:MAG: hypothetical protein SFY66_02740 [Oculatellaceae cyanobacterium bins.114]|nr:hypothetical protein [Oculatellaceae cyanobacterium bins.114]